MNQLPDGAVLMYLMNGKIYPVAMTESQYAMLQALCKVFEPLQIINDPIGEATLILPKKKEGK